MTACPRRRRCGHLGEKDVSRHCSPVALRAPSAQRRRPASYTTPRDAAFKNGYKISKDDPAYGKMSADEKAVNDRRPELYGFWNPGVSKDGEIRKMLKVSVWEQQGRYGPFLAGNTQVPQLKEQAEPATPPTQRAAEIKGGRKPKPERDSR